MIGRVIALLLAVAEITRQVMRHVERNRAQIEAKASEEELQEIQHDPAEWFAKHFGENATVVVRACDHDHGDDAGELHSSAVSDPDPSAETEPNGAGNG